MAAGWEPRVAETHISTLVFLGDRVYKLHKPVRFDFADFSDRAARQRDCQREVALNRRLAPDVYLGVLDVVADGQPVDHVVVMRRLPDDRRLSAMVAAGEPLGPALQAVARTMAVFHAAADRGPDIDAAATPAALAARWAADFAGTAPFVGPLLDPRTDRRIQALVDQYLAGRTRLLRRRIAQGAVCDGHGDLQADDVFVLDDGPRVLDCLEFDDRLRAGDVAADLSFLVMDLQRLGAEGAVPGVLARYEQLTGVRLPPSLVRHYSASRAYVRSLVACLRWAQGDEGSAVAATRLHQLSARNLAAGQIRLVLVGGRPGSGKSTVAGALGGVIDAVVLRSDEVRKELAGLPTDQPAPDGWCEGLYRPEMTDTTYRTLIDRARVALGMGVSVVLDATWADARWRALARRMAADTSSTLVELRCDVPAQLADRRVAARRRVGGDPSDATVAVGRMVAAAASAWPEATVVDTSVTRRAALVGALQAVGWPPSMTPPAPGRVVAAPAAEERPAAPRRWHLIPSRPDGARSEAPRAEGDRR